MATRKSEPTVQLYSTDQFTTWGSILCRLWALGAYACLIGALAYALTANEPFFTRLLTVVVLGIIPAGAMLSIGVLLRAIFSCASWCYRKSEPTIDTFERTCLDQGKGFVGVVRSS